jgi:hypothetical protein
VYARVSTSFDWITGHVCAIAPQSCGFVTMNADSDSATGSGALEILPLHESLFVFNANTIATTGNSEEEGNSVMTGGSDSNNGNGLSEHGNDKTTTIVGTILMVLVGVIALLAVVWAIMWMMTLVRPQHKKANVRRRDALDAPPSLETVTAAGGTRRDSKEGEEEDMEAEDRSTLVNNNVHGSNEEQEMCSPSSQIIGPQQSARKSSQRQRPRNRMIQKEGTNGNDNGNVMDEDGDGDEDEEMPRHNARRHGEVDARLEPCTSFDIDQDDNANDNVDGDSDDEDEDNKRKKGDIEQDVNVNVDGPSTSKLKDLDAHHHTSSNTRNHNHTSTSTNSPQTRRLSEEDDASLSASVQG